jgi:hypothetical protein
MSAGFKVADDIFWGTNGAVEAYLEALAAQAVGRFGPGDPLATFFQDERDGFFTGKVLFLDKWLEDSAGRRRFVEILDAATDQLLREEAFTEYGREGVATVVARLRARVAAGSSAER